MRQHAEGRNMPEGPHLCTAIAGRKKRNVNNKSKLTVTCGNCSICGGSTILYNVCSNRFFPRWAKTTRATIDDPMTAPLP